MKFTVVSHQLGNEKTLEIFLEREGFADRICSEPVKVGETLRMGSEGMKVRRAGKIPLAMMDFEGTIPTGKPMASRNYVGVVKQLDKGEARILTDTGNFREIEFNGEKLKGRFTIKRMEDVELAEQTRFAYVFRKSGVTKEKNSCFCNCHGEYFENLKQTLHIQDLKIVQELSDDGSLPMKISGVALSEGTWNGLFYPYSEIEKSHEGLAGKKIYLEHKKAADKVVGRVLSTMADSTQRAMLFTAEIYNRQTAEDIKNGLIDSVSVGVTVTRFREAGQLVARNYAYDELSLVDVPACSDCKIQVAAAA